MDHPQQDGYPRWNGPGLVHYNCRPYGGHIGLVRWRDVTYHNTVGGPTLLDF